PATFWGMYNAGGQAISALLHMSASGQLDLAAAIAGNWHYWLTEMLGGTISAEAGWGSKMLLGAAYFLPIYAPVFIVGGFWEVLFCMVRKHEV
ncbi:NADH:ubiquinone reductase (Na(+)-transporting) subunit B, partial [Vibrio vulnificus]|nr:NADH:ubiquinone reductase (Na(+)-transporting) subunit B [Vibrio vulnificus]